MRWRCEQIIGWVGDMPREGAIIIANLALLCIECPKCGRTGQYRIDRLVCSVQDRREAVRLVGRDDRRLPTGKKLNDMCDARCPDLAKVGKKCYRVARAVAANRVSGGIRAIWRAFSLPSVLSSRYAETAAAAVLDGRSQLNPKASGRDISSARHVRLWPDF